jgi:hypothetical protein
MQEDDLDVVFSMGYKEEECSLLNEGDGWLC